MVRNYKFAMKLGKPNVFKMRDFEVRYFDEVWSLTNYPLKVQRGSLLIKDILNFSSYLTENTVSITEDQPVNEYCLRK